MTGHPTARQTFPSVLALLRAEFTNHLPDTITEQSIDRATGRALDTILGDGVNPTRLQFAAEVAIWEVISEDETEEFRAAWRTAMATHRALHDGLDPITDMQWGQLVRDTTRAYARQVLEDLADGFRAATR